MYRALPILAVMILGGCTTDAINVSEGVLAEKVNYHWLLSTREGERIAFSPMDEKVVLSVRLDYNYRGSYEWYKVEWIAPSGEPYKVVSTRTEFGSHRDLKAELLIRGKMAAALPGLWRVRLSHLGRDDEPDRLLISRLFRIEAMSEDMRASIVIDPPRPDERPLAGDLPAGAILDGGSGQEPVALGLAEEVTPDSPGPRPGKRAASEAQAASARVPPPAATSTATMSAPLPPESGVLNVDLSAPPRPVSDGKLAGTAVATPLPSASVGFRRRWPGCPPLYYRADEGCVEQAPEE